VCTHLSAGSGLAGSIIIHVHPPAVKSLFRLKSPGDKLMQLLPTVAPRISPVAKIRSTYGRKRYVHPKLNAMTPKELLPEHMAATSWIPVACCAGWSIVYSKDCAERAKKSGRSPARPGLLRPARILSMYTAPPSKALKHVAILTTWPPPSSSDPSTCTHCPQFSIVFGLGPAESCPH
jgi:hypothetical protein